jgi:hypothetical protein
MVLQVYRRLRERPRELTQFREFQGYRFPLWTNKPPGLFQNDDLEVASETI